MNHVSPDLAAKVLAAGDRNVIKAVGEGTPLRASDKQDFLAFAADASDDEMLALRHRSLLKKYLFGGNLSEAERAEISHVLPSGPVKITRERYQRAATDYGHIAVSRRTFFRWVKHGKECPAGHDLPPFDDPATLEVWYERMRAQGLFKNAFPKEIQRAVALHLGKQPPSAKQASKPAQAQAKSGASPASKSESKSDSSSSDEDPINAHDFEPGSAQGLLYEVEYNEKRIAQIRMARDEAERRGRIAEARLLTLEYNELTDKTSMLKRRALEAAEKDGILVPEACILDVLSPKITAIVQTGPFMYDRIDGELAAEPDRQKRRALFRRHWVQFCRGLVEGRFAPPLNLEALIA
jgi:hypothetical protein